MPVSEVIDSVQIIDVDTHVTEPPDLWTSRMSSAKWGDKIPYVRWDDRWNEERCFEVIPTKTIKATTQHLAQVGPVMHIHS